MSKGIVTEYNDYCVFCGRPTEAQHHLIWGKGNREVACGLTEEMARSEFRLRFGESYL